MTTDDQNDDAPRDEPLDLTALRSLSLDPARHAALADRIVAAATPLLARRASRKLSTWEALADYARPMLLTAAAALVLAVGLGRRSATGAEAGGDVVAGNALALGSVDSILPAGLSGAEWLTQQTAPTDAELARAIGLETDAGSTR